MEVYTNNWSPAIERVGSYLYNRNVMHIDGILFDFIFYYLYFLLGKLQFHPPPNYNCFAQNSPSTRNFKKLLASMHAFCK